MAYSGGSPAKGTELGVAVNIVNLTTEDAEERSRKKRTEDVVVLRSLWDSGAGQCPGIMAVLMSPFRLSM
jgi:hypothetical protein